MNTQGVSKNSKVSVGLILAVAVFGAMVVQPLASAAIDAIREKTETRAKADENRRRIRDLEDAFQETHELLRRVEPILRRMERRNSREGEPTP